jgi:hypothetical protein
MSSDVVCQWILPACWPCPSRTQTVPGTNMLVVHHGVGAQAHILHPKLDPDLRSAVCLYSQEVQFQYLCLRVAISKMTSPPQDHACAMRLLRTGVPGKQQRFWARELLLLRQPSTCSQDWASNKVWHVCRQ